MVGMIMMMMFSLLSGDDDVKDNSNVDTVTSFLRREINPPSIDKILLPSSILFSSKTKRTSNMQILFHSLRRRPSLVSTGLLLSSHSFLSFTSPRKTSALQMSSSAASTSPHTTIYGLPPGPFSVGVTTVQFTDPDRADPGNPQKRRSLQTEIWYPCEAMDDSAPRNKYSDFLGIKNLPEEKQADALAQANSNKAIGGYRDGLTIQELDDNVWINRSLRDAQPLPQECFPLVVFSHGSGAYRASYIYWCEYLASHGYVVAAPDHPGSARYTVVDGEVVVPGGPRSDRKTMERERPLDVCTVMDGMERLAKEDARFQGRVDCSNVAVTGMSFGGYTTAEYLEFQDPRVKAAIMQCPSIAKSGTTKLATERKNKETPVMVMLGTEDTVLGEDANQAGRDYIDNHLSPSSYLLEIVRGGHVSFTSCEIYDPDYGNGIGANKECPSLTKPGETYMPLDIAEQHRMINSYGLAFLNAHLKNKAKDAEYLKENHFAESGELIFRKGKKVS
jgi:dienelactone hydrolase